MDDDDDYKIGFGKPPVATRFKKGQSGNPRGRPKRDPPDPPPKVDLRIPALFRAISSQMVSTNGPNGPQEMSKIEAGITQLVNKVASGDLKALKMWLFLSSKFPELLQEGNHDGFRVVFVGPDGDDLDSIEEYNAAVKKAEEAKKAEEDKEDIKDK